MLLYNTISQQSDPLLLVRTFPVSIIITTAIILNANFVAMSHQNIVLLLVPTGIANSGIGVGLFVYAPLCRWLLETYGWRGTLLMLAAVWMHGMVAASLLKPLPSPVHATDGDAWQERHPLHSSLPMLVGGSLLGDSYRSLSSASHKQRQQYKASMLGASYMSLTSSASSTEHKQQQQHNTSALDASYMSLTSSVDCDVKTKMLEVAYLSVNTIDSEKQFQGSSFAGTSCKSVNTTDTHHQQNHNTSIASNSCTNLSAMDQQTPKTQQNASGSLCNNMAASIKNMMDIKAFANIYVILFTLAQVFGCGFQMVPVYLPQKCIQDGLHTTQIALLLSMSGTADTAGRILFGFLGVKFDHTCLYALCFCMTGVGMIAVAYTNNFWFLLVCLLTGYIFWGKQYH